MRMSVGTNNCNALDRVDSRNRVEWQRFWVLSKWQEHSNSSRSRMLIEDVRGIDRSESIRDTDQQIINIPNHLEIFSFVWHHYICHCVWFSLSHARPHPDSSIRIWAVLPIQSLICLVARFDMFGDWSEYDERLTCDMRRLIYWSQKIFRPIIGEWYLFSSRERQLILLNKGFANLDFGRYRYEHSWEWKVGTICKLSSNWPERPFKTTIALHGNLELPHIRCCVQSKSLCRGLSILNINLVTDQNNREIGTNTDEILMWRRGVSVSCCRRYIEQHHGIIPTVFVPTSLWKLICGSKRQCQVSHDLKMRHASIVLIPSHTIRLLSLQTGCMLSPKKNLSLARRIIYWNSESRDYYPDKTLNRIFARVIEEPKWPSPNIGNSYLWATQWIIWSLEFLPGSEMFHLSEVYLYLYFQKRVITYTGARVIASWLFSRHFPNGEMYQPFSWMVDIGC